VTLAQRHGCRDFGAVQRYPGAGAGLRTAETDDVQWAQGSQSGQQPRIDLAAGKRDLGGASDVDTVVVQQLGARDLAVSDVRRELPTGRAAAASPDPFKAPTVRAGNLPLTTVSAQLTSAHSAPPEHNRACQTRYWPQVSSGYSLPLKLSMAVSSMPEK